MEAVKITREVYVLKLDDDYVHDLRKKADERGQDVKDELVDLLLWAWDHYLDD